MRDSVCQKCRRDVKVCRNCKFYDENAYYECKETIADRVADKERSNFCEYFVYTDKIDSAKQTNAVKKSDDAKKNFLNLFKDE